MVIIIKYYKLFYVNLIILYFKLIDFYIIVIELIHVVILLDIYRRLR